MVIVDVYVLVQGFSWRDPAIMGNMRALAEMAKVWMPFNAIVRISITICMHNLLL